jgi:RND family efflux transporter MFP subunit
MGHCWLGMPEKAGKENSMNETSNRSGGIPTRGIRFSKLILLASLVALVVEFVACSGSGSRVQASTITVGVTKVVRKSLGRQITLSSELVPFQEIDVYAKESGYVKKLLVDYGTRVKAGQVMAILEIPELEAQLQEDQAEIRNAINQVSRAQHELYRYQAQYKALHLRYTRLNEVSESQPGIVAQQEVDDAQGKDVAASSQVDAGQAAFEASQSQLSVTKAKLVHDQSLFDYSRITAPFSGIVTERYANLGTLVQAGTGSSTQAIPIVRLSQDDLFRLVIPVPESYVRYIRVGDHVDVRVPSLNRTFPGKVARFSVDVKEETRTMHTEVDVSNNDRVLMPGLYADADLTLEHKEDIPSVPLQAVNHEGDKTTVFVVNANSEIEDRPVSLGIQTASDAEVVAGLSEGELVVVSDRSALKPGEKVHPQVVPIMQYHESNQE